MNKRVPPPPSGARKGAPPPMNKPIKPVKQPETLPQQTNTIQQTQNTQITEVQKPVFSPSINTKIQQPKESQQKPIVPSLNKNKPPIPNKRPVPNILQKPKVVPSLPEIENKQTQIKQQQPKLVEPPVQQKQIPVSIPRQKEQYGKDSQMNTIRSKLDQVLNARSLLLQNSESQQQGSVQDNEDILDAELKQQQPIDNTSQQFQQLKEQSNESSAKQIKDDLQIVQPIVQNIPIQNIPVQPVQQKIQIVSDNPINVQPIQVFQPVPQPPQPKVKPQKPSRPSPPIPKTNTIQIKKQQESIEKGQQRIAQSNNNEQSNMIKNSIKGLRDKQRTMKNELQISHRRLLQQQQQYLNQIQILKRRLSEKQQIITQLKSS